MKLTEEQIEEIRKRAEVGPFVDERGELVFDSYGDIPKLIDHISELENEVKRLTKNGAILIRAALGNPSQEDIDHLVAHLAYETKCRELNGKGDADA